MKEDKQSFGIGAFLEVMLLPNEITVDDIMHIVWGLIPTVDVAELIELLDRHKFPTILQEVAKRCVAVVELFLLEVLTLDETTERIFVNPFSFFGVQKIEEARDKIVDHEERKIAEILLEEIRNITFADMPECV
ncbi:MAG: hypothetical protein COY09_01545 [Candidatus Portnoybacteria bacterium CG_4_10_14_0_2_um_filter_39_11]|uniref:Uncharacterized protein n=1 Tax=Candidatus Portnoybacteria bacterium CG_4_10_14_0_2_um_filter_39_11 TaxID=1974797 RepID=A0A2M7UII4_9BACT|nr:MAG: hypothetical protein AUJ33_00305 [Parcubacteria group bacterium CG1_02_40_25]PIZ71055.1 MAG: hypothetical protein COY09_01545 [Candidatus Portnoybacteria bacterium CG_4_10_14_0_2_um_filter_39_11]